MYGAGDSLAAPGRTRYAFAMSKPTGFAAALAFFAIACLAGEYTGVRWLVYVAKPAATLSVLALALLGPLAVSPRYRALVAAGLVASLAGDIWLMLPGDRFVPGLASFLVAHLLYIAAFAGAGGGWRGPGTALGVAVVAGAILALLWPGLGALKGPVVAYVVVIAAMAWQAIARWRRVVGERAESGASAAFAAAGAVAFLASDASLAIRRFVADFPAGPVVVLATYWFAQYLIARSVGAASVAAAGSAPTASAA
jgi:uncharacterized membrane protein YhhN